MSLEAALAELTLAIRENTACLNASLSQVTLKPAPAKKAAAAAAAPAAPVAAPVVAPVAVAPVAAPATARLPTADTAAAVTPAQIKAAGDDLSLLAEIASTEDPKVGRNTAVAILGEFGVQKMTAMPPANIPEFHSRIKAAIARLQGQPATPSLI
jgi:hypothetical protein